MFHHIIGHIGSAVTSRGQGSPQASPAERRQPHDGTRHCRPRGHDRRVGAGVGVENILDDSNPANQAYGEDHTQRGADGTGGFAAISEDQCPSAADQPDGQCPIGWLAADILVTANNDFLAANPAARVLFEAVRLSVIDVSVANLAMLGGEHPTDLAAQWIADNRDLVDEWIAAARAAGPGELSRP